jgi:hypothetical protein
LLRQGTPVPIYGPASFLDWSVFKIRGVTRQSDRFKRPGALIRVKAIAGSLCPEEGECWLSIVQCRHQVAPGLGYSRPRSSRSRHPAKYPWLVPEQLMGHWFLGRAEAKRDAPFWITDMETSAAVRTRNRGLVRHRYRIDSMKVAHMKMAAPGIDVKKPLPLVMASDGFFPFRDTVDEAAKMGVAAIIQPGGSVRDEESIAAANEHGIAMLFTSVRHFKH